ncbi:MAG: hypothetical protein ACYC9S_05725 [Leptospirales bacterium]
MASPPEQWRSESLSAEKALFHCTFIMLAPCVLSGRTGKNLFAASDGPKRFRLRQVVSGYGVPE